MEWEYINIKRRGNLPPWLPPPSRMQCVLMLEIQKVGWKVVWAVSFVGEKWVSKVLMTIACIQQVWYVRNANMSHTQCSMAGSGCYLKNHCPEGGTRKSGPPSHHIEMIGSVKASNALTNWLANRSTKRVYLVNFCAPLWIRAIRFNTQRNFQQKAMSLTLSFTV